MKTLTLLISLIALLLAPVTIKDMGNEAQAQGYSILEQKTLAQDTRVAPGETWKATLPPLERGSGRLLKITIRYENPELGGYGTYAAFALNGVPLDAAKNRYESRMVNKPLSFTRETGQTVSWNLGDGIWHTIFAPNFETSFARYGPDVRDPYSYVLDVSDLLKTNQSNELTITSTVPANLERELVFSVEWMSANLPGQKTAVAAPTVSSQPALTVKADGTLQIATSEKPVTLNSSFSVPGGGQNRFGSRSQELQWQPKVSQPSAGQWKIEAEGKSYRLTRQIHQSHGRIQVQDTFRNLTDEDVGIIFTNEFDLAPHPGINFLRIGGQRGQGVNNIFSAGNPTLFLPLKDSSLTMVVEDDVYRNQGNFYFNTNSKKSGISNGMFALAPRAQYTLKWSIYTLSSNDYYDMINRVRRDWNVNFQVQGPIYFDNYHGLAKSTPEALKQMIDRNKIGILAFWEIIGSEPSPAWDNKRILGRGVGMLGPESQEQLELQKQAVANLHTADPNIKVAPYNHAFFIAPEKADDPKFKDSWIIDENGQRAKSQYSDEVFYIDRTVFPAHSNSYGKAYLGLMDYLFDEIKVDWLYWDESDGPGLTQPDKSAPGNINLPSNVTYNAWDGYSAVIDPQTGLIERKFGILPLLSDGVFSEIINKTKARGGNIQFNGVPVTASRQQSQTQSFVEVQWDITWAYRTHLTSPMAFGLGSPDMATLRRALDFGNLYARTHIGYNSDIVSRFYPFTPISLHEGWVKGQERIITNRSDIYGWDEPFTGTLYLYGKDKKIVETKQFDTPRHAVDVEVPDGGIAVLVRNDK